MKAALIFLLLIAAVLVCAWWAFTLIEKNRDDR